MKNWLAAAGRFCLDFILLLLLMSLCLVLIRKPGQIAAEGLFAAFLGGAGSCFGPAVLAAIFLASYSFERKLKRSWAVWLSLFLLGAAFMAGGEGLRRLGEGGMAQIPAKAPAIIAGEGTSHGSGAAATEAGAQARKRTIVLEGSESPAEWLAGEFPAFRFALEKRLGGIGGLPLPLAAASIGALLLLGLGLSAFARLPRWEIIGFFFTAGGFPLVFLFDAALMGPDAASIYGRLGPRLGMAGLAAEIWAAVAEAALGLLLLLSSCLAKARRES